MSVSISDLVPEHVRTITAYQPGKPIEELERELGISGAIKLASNENPLGASQQAIAAATKALGEVEMYPDGGAFALRARLASDHGINPDQLVFGAGSNEIIYLLINAFCRPGDRVVSHKFAFVSYVLATKSFGHEFFAADVKDDLSCDVDALIAAIDERTKIVFLANPNNPTGAYVPRSDFERLLEAIPDTAILVVDEAYNEYATRAADDYPSARDYQSKYPKLVTLRTFSKIHGLAGLRVGYAVAEAELAGHINRIRRPFNVNMIGQRAALAALQDSEHVERSSAVARASIAELSSAAQKLGLRAYPSVTNFVLLDLGRPSGPVCDALQRKGVITRPMKAWGLPSCVRVSIGTEEDTSRACAALAEVL